jgi:hypothetical protein
VVRGEHLKRTRDLSAWDITNLGDDRHLVVARDPSAWDRQRASDHDVLARGRRDWGDALITPEVIEQNPAT